MRKKVNTVIILTAIVIGREGRILQDCEGSDVYSKHRDHQMS